MTKQTTATQNTANTEKAKEAKKIAKLLAGAQLNLERSALKSIKKTEVNAALFDDAKECEAVAKRLLKRKELSLQEASACGDKANKTRYKSRMMQHDKFMQWAHKNDIDCTGFDRNDYGKALCLFDYATTGLMSKHEQSDYVNRFHHFVLCGAKNIEEKAQPDPINSDMVIGIQSIARVLGKPNDLGKTKAVAPENQPKFLIDAIVRMGWGSYTGSRKTGNLTLSAKSPFVEQFNKAASKA